MASLDSANGPSDKTFFPFFPETILPPRSSGLPATALPWAIRPWNQVIHWPTTLCISSGERPLDQSLPRNSSIYSLLFSVLIISLVNGYFQAFNDMTNGRTPLGHLFCLGIHFPNRKGIVFGVLANGEVAHSRHGG